MGANESVILSALEKVNAITLQDSSEISNDLVEQCRNLWSSISPGSKKKLGLCACYRASKPNNSKKQDIIIPEALTSAVEEWIKKPDKFFNKNGFQLDLLASESPAKAVKCYAGKLGKQDDSVLDTFRERFVKIIMMKLSDIGQIAEGVSAVIANSECEIDVPQYVNEGRRLYGLCRDIGKCQDNLDHAELGNLFALPQYATTEFIRRIPQRRSDRQTYIEQIQECGVLELQERGNLEKLANAIMAALWEPIEKKLAPSFTVLRMADPRSKKPGNKKRKNKGNHGPTSSRSQTTTNSKKQKTSNLQSSSDVQLRPVSQITSRDNLETLERVYPEIPTSQQVESQTEPGIEDEELQMHNNSTLESIGLPTNRTHDLQSPQSISKSPRHGPLRPCTQEDRTLQAPQPSREIVSDELDCLNIPPDRVGVGQPMPTPLFHDSTESSFLESNSQALQTPPRFGELIRLNMHQGGVHVPDTSLDSNNTTNFSFSDPQSQALETSLTLGELMSPGFDELVRLNMHLGGAPVPDTLLEFHNSAEFSFPDLQNHTLENTKEIESSGADELIRLNMHQGGYLVPDTLLNLYNPPNLTRPDPHSQALQSPLAPGETESSGADEPIRLDMHQGGFVVPDTLLNLYNPPNLACPDPHSQALESPLAPGETESSGTDEPIRLDMHQGGYLVPDTLLNLYNPPNLACPDPHSQALQSPLAPGETESSGADKPIRLDMHQGGGPVADILSNFYNLTNLAFTPNSQTLEMSSEPTEPVACRA